MSLKNNQELATTCYKWDIANFVSLLRSDIKCLVKSPLFNKRSINEKWKFLIYPDGEHDSDSIGFYLSKVDASNQALYNITLSIGKPNQIPMKSYEYMGERFVIRVIGEELFLCNNSNSWIFKGQVRFKCDITKIEDKNYLTQESFDSSAHINLADTQNLSLDLEKLLKIPFHSDLSVSMNGNEMYLHKYMLYAGFRRTITLVESLGIEVSDQTFELLMHYIYTGKLGESYIPVDLLRCAEALGLSSLIQCVHEPAYDYHVYSEADLEVKVIEWNLDELNFWEEVSTCIHMLRTTLYAEQLAIQLSISDGCEKEKFIDVSLKFFGVYEHRPIMLISKISLTSGLGLDSFHEKTHVFIQDEQWNFPRLECEKVTECCCDLDMRLTAELSMCELPSLNDVKCIKTKTKLHTQFQTVTDNLTYLHSSMAWLLQMAHSTSNLVLLSDDNRFYRVHDGIVWARWPGVKKLLDNDSSDEEDSDFVNQLELKLPSEVLDILIPYLYTGFIANFDQAKAEMLIKYSSEYEFPHHLVKKCEALLSVNHEN